MESGELVAVWLETLPSTTTSCKAACMIDALDQRVFRCWKKWMKLGAWVSRRASEKQCPDLFIYFFCARERQSGAWRSLRTSARMSCPVAMFFDVWGGWRLAGPCLLL